MLVLTFLVGRLVYLMIFCSEYYGKKAEDLHERERNIKAARGEIVDCNGVVLAEKQDRLYNFSDTQSDQRTGKSHCHVSKRTRNG